MSFSFVKLTYVYINPLYILDQVFKLAIIIWIVNLTINSMVTEKKFLAIKHICLTQMHGVYVFDYVRSVIF